MTLGFGWGRLFPLICLGLLGLGQALGVEPEAEKRLVYVVLEGEPAADVAVRLRERGLAKREIAEATRQRIAEIATQQDQLVARLGQAQASIEAQFSRLANAIKVRLPLGQVEPLRQLDGVVDVKPVAQFHPLTSTSVPFIGATNVWNLGKLSATGKGIRIGIIDSGIDYTHAMFGGSGKDTLTGGSGADMQFGGANDDTFIVSGGDGQGDTFDGGSGNNGTMVFVGQGGDSALRPNSAPLDELAT